MSGILGKLRRRFGEEPARPMAPVAGESFHPAADAASRAAAERDEILARLRRKIAELDRKWQQPAVDQAAAPRRAAAMEALPGRLIETSRGSVRLIVETVSGRAVHGRFVVGDFASAAALDALHLLYRLPCAPDPERIVFLDTETTGLAGGAGTLPFLVGLAWLDGGDLRLEQLFLDHPRQEPALVAYLHERLRRFTHACTYNGRAFDLPLLANRFVLHRTPVPALDAALDLLPAARRLHCGHLDDRSLSSVERAVLGFSRADDVPGAEIPGIYHRFLLTGRAERLAEVIRHNAWDVIALAALLGVHARLLRDGAAALGLDPAVDLALGELRYARGDLDGAAAHFVCAAERAATERAVGGPDGVWASALVGLARTLRRRGRHEEAASCWRRILERLPDHGVAHLGLAKHYEHRAREFALAERHARAAARAGAEGAEEALRRIARLRAKLDAAP